MKLRPDAETLLLAGRVRRGRDDETATEEAVAALTALDSEGWPHHRPGAHVHARDGHGRAAHPRRRDRHRQAHRGRPEPGAAALASFPWSIQLLLEEYDQHKEGKKRLAEVVPASRHRSRHPKPAPAERRGQRGGDGRRAPTRSTTKREEETTAVDTGPDPARGRARMDLLRSTPSSRRLRQGRPDRQEGLKLREEIAEEFLLQAAGR
jgi:RNA polymerase primary sigma factor